MTDLRAISNAMFNNDAASILSAMTGVPVVRDQRLGTLNGRAEVERWVAESASWLRGLHASSSELAYISSERREVLELSLSIRVQDGVVDLPYVLVADRGPDGFTEIRTYHSTWPYTGGHVFRAPPLAGRAPEPVAPIFQRYIDQVRIADVASVLQSFTPDGYVREPSGNRWKHQGPEGRAAFYGHLVHAPRAQFSMMTCTVDGAHIAVEYGFAYGNTEFVGGICIMEVNQDRIAAVRITDDVGV